MNGQLLPRRQRPNRKSLHNSFFLRPGGLRLLSCSLSLSLSLSRLSSIRLPPPSSSLLSSMRSSIRLSSTFILSSENLLSRSSPLLSSRDVRSRLLPLLSLSSLPRCAMSSCCSSVFIGSLRHVNEELWVKREPAKNNTRLRGRKSRDERSLYVVLLPPSSVLTSIVLTAPRSK